MVGGLGYGVLQDDFEEPCLPDDTCCMANWGMAQTMCIMLKTVGGVPIACGVVQRVLCIRNNSNSVT